MSDTRKKIVKLVKKESKHLFETALRSGAKNIGKELQGAMSDVNQPSNILLEKLFTALKSGAFATGEEVFKEGIRPR